MSILDVSGLCRGKAGGGRAEDVVCVYLECILSVSHKGRLEYKRIHTRIQIYTLYPRYPSPHAEDMLGDARIR